jgi:septal ring factor EnvC (AmiA/AmiB activator)
METNKISDKKKIAKKSKIKISLFFSLIILSLLFVAFLFYARDQKDSREKFIKNVAQNFSLVVEKLNESGKLQEEIETLANNDSQILTNIQKQIETVNKALEISDNQIKKFKETEETSFTKKNSQLSEEMIAFYQEVESVYSNYLNYLHYFNNFNDLKDQINNLIQESENNIEDLTGLEETIREKLASITPPPELEGFHQELMKEIQVLEENSTEESSNFINYKEEIEPIYKNIQKRMEAVNLKAKTIKILIIKEQSALKLEPLTLKIEAWK